MENEFNNQSNSIADDVKLVGSRGELEKFDDLSGVTVKKLERGLWWVQNIKFIKRTLFWFVIALGIISWMYTIGSFGYYMISGERNDDLMLTSITSNNTLGHDYFVSIGAQNVVIGDVQTFNPSTEKYDFMTSVMNPNQNYYATFKYAVMIDGKPTDYFNGFLLPGEKKYLSIIGYNYVGGVGSASLSIENLVWKRINVHQIPSWEKYRAEHLNFIIGEPHYYSPQTSGLTEKVDVSLIDFSLTNKSPYNYYKLPLNIYLYSFDRIIGVTQAIMHQIGSGETQKVQLNYPGTIDRVDRVEVVPEINIMKSDIYYKFKGEVQE